ncbi:hypothetical protein [Marinomonas mediterranea]|jgi:hypothetical protein|uniref:Uncharacterized protein n=1 Tax=Marinomonas mediterranea (strain ATCC 700492 / JCM 21426 / NBRC 103028 / MMB-1) TaxID=717774 RepID=F2JXI1_MARM1|nr:hypothetical protein [Marinomonas mediterranea]ADZ91881.1 hypothetical protein Marme_2650 [Marinomonas mediterranea MMB-1]WCN09835.1 hypothetical protein GV055_13375 [Marinomonas mediterranea]WCN13920.1 hypothetical protein GV054_13390 [Marinomonas mediterranea]WCN17972.1 hypothetical protein GV053_13415 [Marinomonas mediterranea MMB-1]
MNQQTLLAKIAAHYDFTKANQLASQSQTKPYIRAWLNLDISQVLQGILNGSDVTYSEPYQHQGDYIKFLPKTNQVEACERKYASKADLQITSDKQTNWFEFHVLQKSDLENTRDRNKLYGDIRRVRTLRKHLAPHDTTLLIGIWGSFTTKDLDYFKPLDNQTDCAYVLDTSLTGSTQIARVSHVKREGKPRFLLIAC